MVDELKVKVWKDRLGAPHPVRWCWEVKQDVGTTKIVGCGTARTERASREAAARVVDERTRSPLRPGRRRRFTVRLASI